MVEAINAYLLSLASARSYFWTNPLTGQRERVSGRLRIYTNRKETPDASDAISLPRLVEHLAQWGATESDVKRAIGMLFPTAGVGRKIHVWFYTEDRANEIKEVRAQLSNFLRDAQRANRMMYLAEIGVTDSSILPDLNLGAATVN